MLTSQRRPTPGRSVRDVEDTIVELVDTLSAQYDVAAVGIGAAGFVDAARATVLFSPHLAWRDEPLRAALMQRIAVPVVVDNDANTAALAECRFGAGVGHRYVLCITLGTGIGGALVIDNKVFRGQNGMAGEFGHMQVVPDGPPLRVRQPGLLGAVRLGQRAGPRRARAGAGRLPGGPRPQGPGRRRRRPG